MTLKKKLVPGFALVTANTNKLGSNRVRVADSEFPDHIFLGVSANGYGVRGVRMTRDEAIKVRDALTAQIDSFVQPTFQEQFAELSVGDQFSVDWGNPGGNAFGTRKAIKVDDKMYYSYTRNLLRQASNAHPSGVITKN